MRPVGLVLDLHGHSRKQGIFTYGCIPDKRHMRPTSPQTVLVLSKNQQSQQDTMKEARDMNRENNTSNNNNILINSSSKSGLRNNVSSTILDHGSAATPVQVLS